MLGFWVSVIRMVTEYSFTLVHKNVEYNFLEILFEHNLGYTFIRAFYESI